MQKFLTALGAAVVGLAVVDATQAPQTQTPPVPTTPANVQQAIERALAQTPPSNNLGSDPNGNPVRLALKTKHVSNYDEAKVPPYTLPDPLVLANGQRVRDAATWEKRRRAEILDLYLTEIYGRIPDNTPTVTWNVVETEPGAREGAAVRRKVVGQMGPSADGPKINLTVYTPANVKGRAPMILLVNFGGGASAAAAASATQGPAAGAASAAQGTGRANAPAGRGGLGGDPPVAAEILSRGWGYAMVGYNDIQPDRANAWSEGVIGLTLKPGQSAPAPNEWGTISAWSWGISRIIDFLERDASVDPKRIAIQGHSRLGKTVLWASALDQRIAAVFSSCSGEMGAALARRDWGESVDDMAQNFGHQFAGNLQKYVGKWNEMPVDAHMLIALSAPRPAYITGGTTDQWADPKGEFLATVAAGPVYTLLGKKPLGVTELPPLDTPIITGDLGWHYHTGGHMATQADWTAFLSFLDKSFTLKQ